MLKVRQLDPTLQLLQASACLGIQSQLIFDSNFLPLMCNVVSLVYQLWQQGFGGPVQLLISKVFIFKKRTEEAKFMQLFLNAIPQTAFTLLLSLSCTRVITFQLRTTMPRRTRLQEQTATTQITFYFHKFQNRSLIPTIYVYLHIPSFLTQCFLFLYSIWHTL